MKKDTIYIICLILILFSIFCIADVHWSKYHVKGGGKLLMGLWKQCGENLVGGDKDRNEECIHLPPEGDKNFPKNSLYACRSLSLLGLVFLLGAVGCMMYKEEVSKACVATMLAIAGVCTIVSGVVWMTELLKLKMPDGSTLKMKPCYAYYLNMLVGLMTLGLAGYVTFM